MPLLNKAWEKFAGQNASAFEEMTVVASQHLLPTIIPLFERIIDSGARPERIHILAKVYSATPWVVNYLKDRGCNVHVCYRRHPGKYESDLESDSRSVWRTLLRPAQAVSQLLILDHGGFLRRTIPPVFYHRVPMVAIEHTTKGFFSGWINRIPVIDMARSTSKRLLEPSIISDQIIKRIFRDKIPLFDYRIGVIGAGTIGRSLVAALRDLGCSVSVFDTNLAAIAQIRRTMPKVSITSSITELLGASDLIFGSTGHDCLQSVDWRKLHGEKIFLSASSGDIEFSSLLNLVSAQSLTSTSTPVEIRRQHTYCKVLNGGFPYNFDPHSDAPFSAEIDSTRALTYLSLLQGAAMLKANMVIPMQDQYQDFLFSECKRRRIET